MFEQGRQATAVSYYVANSNCLIARLAAIDEGLKLSLQDNEISRPTLHHSALAFVPAFHPLLQGIGGYGEYYAMISWRKSLDGLLL